MRVKRSVGAKKKRNKALKQTKGFNWGRKNKYIQAKDALRHAWAYSFRDRKNKKRTMRQLWQIRINAACRQHGISYSQFINKLKKAKIEIDRKILSQLAADKPEIFAKIVETVKK